MSLEIIDIPLEHFDFEATNEILRHALHWRKMRGITIKWTADLLKIPVRCIYNWNSGVIKHLRPDYYNTLYEFFTTRDKPAYRYGVSVYKANHPEAEKSEPTSDIWICVPSDEDAEPYEVPPDGVPTKKEPEHIPREKVLEMWGEVTRDSMR